MALKLTIAERESALWKKIEREFTERLQALRERNDGNLTAEETAKTRGAISMCKEGLDWAKPNPEIN